MAVMRVLFVNPFELYVSSCAVSMTLDIAVSFKRREGRPLQDLLFPGAEAPQVSSYPKGR